MATVNNDNNNIFTGLSTSDFIPITLLTPIAYGDNKSYYNPWLRTAFKGAKGLRWNEMINRYKNDDLYDDMYAYDDNYKVHVRIDPNNVIPGKKGQWGVYEYTGDDGQKRRIQLSLLNTFYRRNPGLGAASTPTTPSTPSTPAPTGGYLHLNDKTAPVITPNYGAYTYSEWMSDTNPWGAKNFNNIRSLGNIYGDIDTEEELNILAQLLGAQGAINYINSNSGENPLFVNNRFIGNADAVKRAAALLGKYAASDEGKPFYEQLRRGYASLDNMDKYEAYAATKGWTGRDGLADRDYLNEARNSIDKKYNGANFFKKYAGDNVWGTLANEFAQNDYFRNDYVVDALHVMDRLNRDAGLGNGRKLIEIYNDIINNSRDSDGRDLLTPEQRYRIFRDMTRRRFKLNNDFWNRAENGRASLKGIRDKVYSNEDILFKNGGQIFRMLFV